MFKSEEVLTFNYIKTDSFFGKVKSSLGVKSLIGCQHKSIVKHVTKEDFYNSDL